MDVPGVHQTLASNQIRNAAIDFCNRSKAYVVQLDDQTISDQTTVVGLPSKTDLVQILQAWWNGKKITNKTIIELNEWYANWTTQSGTPMYFTRMAPSTITLVPYPTTAGTLSIVAAIAPSPDATGLDKDIFNTYFQEIAHGAKWKLLSMQKKPWSDPNLAVYHKELFDQGCAKAALDAKKSFGGGRIRTVSRFL